MSASKLCLVLIAWSLFYQCSSGHDHHVQSESSLEEFKPSDYDSHKLQEDKSSNPAANFVRKWLSSLRSNVRSANMHHSGLTHRQFHINDARKESAEVGSSFDTSFDEVLSHKRRMCSKESKSYENTHSLCKETVNRRIQRKKEHLHSHSNLIEIGEFEDDALAHAENSTELPTDPTPNELSWVIRERDGRVYESDPLEVDKVVNLYGDPHLPYTYKKLKLGLSPDDKDSFLVGGPRAGRPSSYFIHRVFGRIVVPKDKLLTEPYSSIGLVGKGKGHCTGTFIGPRHVLTAAHCLFENGRWKPNADFLRAKDCKPDIGELYEWEKTIVPTQWMQQEDHEYDYGMIVAKSQMHGHTAMDFGWKDIYLPSDSWAKVFLIGYPVDDADRCMWRDFCTMNTEDLELTFLHHKCEVSKGNSGSPVFSPYTEDPVILCIDSVWRELDDDVRESLCLHIKKWMFASLAHWLDLYA